MFTENKFLSYNRSGEYLDYLKSENHVDDAKAPLILYIHGAGSRGSKLSQIDRVSILSEIEKGHLADKNYIAVAPQCHCDTWFELFDVLIEFIDFMRHNEDVDISRVYVCGPSMGGYTTWQVIMTKPDWFAAAVPMCGGGMYWNCDRIKNLPIWAFHGALDTTVLPTETLNMVSAINSKGGKAKITIVPDVAHNVWDYAFNDETIKWMFSQKKIDKEIDF